VEETMAKKTWEIIVIILGIAVEVVVLIKDKLTRTGGKQDGDGSGGAKA
jgi:hypothetical protein